MRYIGLVVMMAFMGCEEIPPVINPNSGVAVAAAIRQ